MHRSLGLVVVVALLGLIVGQLLTLAIPIEPLQKFADLGFKPVTVDLYVFTLTFGFSFHLSVAGVVGMLVALFLILRAK